MKDPNPIRERVEEAIVRLSLEHPELGEVTAENRAIENVRFWG